jgi:hypothetical protein
MQSKKYSLIEAIVNQIIGFLIALGSQVIIFPFYNIAVTLNHNIQITLWFTLISVIRSYIIRRFFNRI